MERSVERGETISGRNASPWRRTIAVLGTALFVAPATGGLLIYLWRIGTRFESVTGDESRDAVGLLAAHLGLGYVFGAIPALGAGLILSAVAWRRGTFSAATAVLVSVIAMLLYGFAISIIFRSALVRVMTQDLAFTGVCVAITTALLMRALLRWARFI
jgi:hypothetical protein